MGNFGDFYYFYRSVCLTLMSIAAGFILLILSLWFKVEQQQRIIFQLKKELIEYQSREEAEEIIQGWKYDSSNEELRMLLKKQKR